jgi:uncharacterized protein HemY
VDALRLGHTDRGEAGLREIVAEHPANAEALMYLGVLALQTGRVAEAEAALAASVMPRQAFRCPSTDTVSLWLGIDPKRTMRWR